LSFAEVFEILTRWLHVLAGILWIGLLYFLNLVNVPLMKELDGATKGKLIPLMLTRVLFLFRWSALLTWLVGFIYFAVLCGRYNVSHAFLGAWLGLTLLAYAIVFLVLNPKAGLQKDGRVIAAILALVAAVYLFLVWMLYSHHFVPAGGAVQSHVLYSAMGGGLGTFMFLNVWGIIWRNQKRIIAWTKAAAEGGPAIPPEAAGLGRHAFLASRTNAWLSLPMLYFMIAAAHMAFVP
jgi:uncharacterized membrane protein